MGKLVITSVKEVSDGDHANHNVRFTDAVGRKYVQPVSCEVGKELQRLIAESPNSELTVTNVSEVALLVKFDELRNVCLARGGKPVQGITVPQSLGQALELMLLPQDAANRPD